jgi:hypothetical protein
MAGLVAAVAIVAIALLVRGAPAQIVDAASFLGLAAKAMLFLSLAVLFGYAAATGLPPTHWWRSAGQPVWPLQPELPLTPDLQRFLGQLREHHPALRECWLLDSAKPGEWRLLALADPAVLDEVRGDWHIRRRDVRLYLLDELSGTVALAWGRPSPVAFSTWDWEPQLGDLAEFRCPVAADTRLAHRLWS